MKTCPICKKENHTKWKCCSNECYMEAQTLAYRARRLWEDELAMEILPVREHEIFKANMVKLNSEEYKD